MDVMSCGRFGSTLTLPNHDGVFVSDHGTMTFNGDGKTVKVDIDDELAQLMGLSTGSFEGTYVFLSGYLPPVGSVDVRYDVAHELEFRHQFGLQPLRKRQIFFPSMRQLRLPGQERQARDLRLLLQRSASWQYRAVTQQTRSRRSLSSFLWMPRNL